LRELALKNISAITRMIEFRNNQNKLLEVRRQTYLNSPNKINLPKIKQINIDFKTLMNLQTISKYEEIISQLKNKYNKS
jgi:hypothetical protein